MRKHLADFARISGGYHTRKAVVDEADGSHFLLQIRDLDPSRRHVSAEKMIRVSPTGSAAMETLRPGEIIFLAKGAKNFACALNDTLPRPCLAASYFLVIRPDPLVTAPFLAWYMNQPETLQVIAQMATSGANMPIITAGQLRRLEVPIPDLATQAKIVALDALAHQQHTLLLDLAEKKRRLASAACLMSLNKQNPLHPNEIHI